MSHKPKRIGRFSGLSSEAYKEVNIYMEKEENQAGESDETMERDESAALFNNLITTIGQKKYPNKCDDFLHYASTGFRTKYIRFKNAVSALYLEDLYLPGRPFSVTWLTGWEWRPP
jgi:hypothetical protein